MLHALVLGIDDFQDPSIRRLRYAREDAEAMGSLLDRIAPDERRVRTLLDREATLPNLEKAVDDLCREVAEGDLVLFFMASHGTPERRAPEADPSAFLVLYDTEYTSIHATALDLELSLRSWMARLDEAAVVVFFLDTCFSGAAGGRTFARRMMREGAAPPVSLRGLDLGCGGVILAAAGEHQVARESEELGHGVFTYHLLEALQPPPGGPATVGVGTLYEQVARAVANATAGQQRPTLDARSSLAALPLFPRPRGDR